MGLKHKLNSPISCRTCKSLKVGPTARESANVIDHFRETINFWVVNLVKGQNIIEFDQF